jgi:hypothetical protein
LVSAINTYFNMNEQKKIRSEEELKEQKKERVERKEKDD